jgi:hypothetical protein
LIEAGLIGRAEHRKRIMDRPISRRTWLATASALVGGRAVAAERGNWWETGKFRWVGSAPLVSPIKERDDPCHAIKDPTVVLVEGRWHVFATIRSKKRTHQIEYLSFTDWKEADKAKRSVLTITDGYFCAPQVFWFSPHKKWYLIHQASDPKRRVSLQPAFSTSERIDQPGSWTKPTFLFEKHPDNVRSWIDFWVICDDELAHLFFTSNDGRMWRSQTELADFPLSWSRPAVVLEGDIFEASHTYRLKGLNQFLTIIEAQVPGGRRYYKAYLADRLDGRWKPLADTLQKPFAAPVNVKDEGKHWTDSISHGELLRSGYDEKLEVDPARLKFLYQGVAEADRRGKPYGEIPWRLGLLTME